MNYKIIAKYIKTLNFDISKPEKFFSLNKDISNYKFKVDIKSDRFKENIIEIQTTLALEPKDDNFDKINALVTYSTLVELNKDFTDKSPLNLEAELNMDFIFVTSPTFQFDKSPLKLEADSNM